MFSYRLFSPNIRASIQDTNKKATIKDPIRAIGVPKNNVVIIPPRRMIKHKKQIPLFFNNKLSG